MGSTITLATMYPVETQAIWSSVAPRFPIMWGIATFTMLVSSSSSTDASETVIAIRYLKRYRSGPAGSAIAVMLVRLDGRDDAHPRPERMHRVHRAIQVDTHGDPLHDFREVAGGVVGRQQRELRARSRRQALDVPVHVHAFVRIHRDIGRIAGRH